MPQSRYPPGLPAVSTADTVAALCSPQRRAHHGRPVMWPPYYTSPRVVLLREPVMYLSEASKDADGTLSTPRLSADRQGRRLDDGGVRGLSVHSASQRGPSVRRRDSDPLPVRRPARGAGSQAGPPARPGPAWSAEPARRTRGIRRATGGTPPRPRLETAGPRSRCPRPGTSRRTGSAAVLAASRRAPRSARDRTAGGGSPPPSVSPPPGEPRSSPRGPPPGSAPPRAQPAAEPEGPSAGAGPRRDPRPSP